MAYYIGHEKEFTGQLPFSLVVSVAAVCMLGSEIVAMVRKRKRKIGQTNSNNVQGNQGKKMVISNLIPFTKLNLIFVFSALITSLIRIFQNTQIGVPNLSIQLVVMLICLLLTNPEARTHFKRKHSALREVDLEANKPNIFVAPKMNSAPDTVSSCGEPSQPSECAELVVVNRTFHNQDLAITWTLPNMTSAC